MKGLLTKDFALFTQRKKTFIFLAVWAVVMCLTMDGGSFVVGWMTVISSFFAISSITYDEYDNCYPFLMSLPITSKIYAVEKYLFGFLCGIGAWLFSVVVCLVFAIVKGTMGEFGSDLVQLLIFIPVFMLLIDISLPINIKFGSERGRTIILIIWGVVFVGLFVATKFLKIEPSIDTEAISIGELVGVSYALAAVLTAVSVALSIRMMGKKEF